MKILILGGSGRTGKRLVAEAIRRNHHVNILVRDKTKVGRYSNLTIFEGTPADLNMLEKAVEDCEIVISALNISRNSDFPWAKLRTPQNFLSTTIKNLIAISEKHCFRRVIIISAWGVAESGKEIPRFFKWLVDNSNLRYAYKEHENQEKMLQASNLNWTAVRPVGLTNGPAKDRVKVSFGGKPRPGMMISRKTVAQFILDIAEQHLYINKAPTISS